MFAIIKFNLSCRQKNKRHSKSNGLFICHGAENTFYTKFRPLVCLSVEFFKNISVLSNVLAIGHLAYGDVEISHTL